MDILILSNYGFDDPSDNIRFQYLAKELHKEHDVEIITSDFSHGKKAHLDITGSVWPYKVTRMHEPGYRKNICLKRLYSHHVWGRNVEAYLKKRKKPDIIYCAVPSLTGPFAAAKFCEKKSVRFVIDVQDLWPEAYQMVFHIPVVSDMLFSPFRYLADGIYKRADEICAVSHTYIDRVLRVNKKCKLGHCVFLGTELRTFDENVKSGSFMNVVGKGAEIVLTKRAGEFWLGYCGTLGHSYDLTCVMDSLALLRERGSAPIRLVIMGDGPKRKEFEEYARKKNVDAYFTGMLSYKSMCGLLASCDMAVNPITHNAAQSIINKHADYAAAGIPVVSTQECEEYRKLVEEYHMGFNCENNDAEDLAEKIEILIKDAALREEMGRNARRCAKEKFDREITYREIVGMIHR